MTTSWLATVRPGGEGLQLFIGRYDLSSFGAWLVGGIGLGGVAVRRRIDPVDRRRQPASPGSQGAGGATAVGRRTAAGLGPARVAATAPRLGTARIGATSATTATGLGPARGSPVPATDISWVAIAAIAAIAARLGAAGRSSRPARSPGAGLEPSDLTTPATHRRPAVTRSASDVRARLAELREQPGWVDPVAFGVGVATISRHGDGTKVLDTWYPAVNLRENEGFAALVADCGGPTSALGQLRARSRPVSARLLTELGPITGDGGRASERRRARAGPRHRDGPSPATEVDRSAGHHVHRVARRRARRHP